MVAVKPLVPFNYHVRNNLFSWSSPVCYFVCIFQKYSDLIAVLTWAGEKNPKSCEITQTQLSTEREGKDWKVANLNFKIV